MLLAVDAGNSRAKWALWDGDAWRDHGSVPINDSFAPLGACAVRADACVVSCVAPAKRCTALLRELDGLAITRVRAAAAGCGVLSRYRPPDALGADRWCALVAMRARCGHGVAVLAGTAVTIDCLAADGVFTGGLILPGRRLMHGALGAGTPLATPAPADHLPSPDHTAGAIAAGSLHAIVGAINEHRRASDASDAPLLLAGGDAVTLARLLPNSQLVPDLVLDGLRAIHAEILESSP